MGYKSFEELPAWNAAIDLAVRTVELTATRGLHPYAGLKDQIERAAVSVSNNIAEGFERGTHDELLTFLYYALGSAGEERSMLLLIQRLPGGDALRAHTDELIPIARSVSRQLNAWIESLKNSGSRGPRYQTHATRTAQKTHGGVKRFSKSSNASRTRPETALRRTRSPLDRSSVIGHQHPQPLTADPNPCVAHRHSPRAKTTARSRPARRQRERERGREGQG